MILFPRSSVSDQGKQSRRKLFPFLAPSNAHASSSRSQEEPLPRKSKKKLFFTAKIHSSLGNSIKFCLETGGSNAVGEATCRRSKMERKKKGGRRWKRDVLGFVFPPFRSRSRRGHAAAFHLLVEFKRGNVLPFEVGQEHDEPENTVDNPSGISLDE